MKQFLLCFLLLHHFKYLRSHFKDYLLRHFCWPAKHIISFQQQKCHHSNYLYEFFSLFMLFSYFYLTLLASLLTLKIFRIQIEHGTNKISSYLLWVVNNIRLHEKKGKNYVTWFFKYWFMWHYLNLLICRWNTYHALHSNNFLKSKSNDMRAVAERFGIKYLYFNLLGWKIFSNNTHYFLRMYF